MSETIQTPVPGPLEAAESLALSALTDILRDPEASRTDKRLAAATILRHAATSRATDRRLPRDTVRSSGRCTSTPTVLSSEPQPIHPRSCTTPAQTPAPASCNSTDPVTSALPSRLDHTDRPLTSISRLLELSGSPGSRRSPRPHHGPPALASPILSATDS